MFRHSRNPHGCDLTDFMEGGVIPLAGLPAALGIVETLLHDHDVLGDGVAMTGPFVVLVLKLSFDGSFNCWVDVVHDGM